MAEIIKAFWTLIGKGVNLFFYACGQIPSIMEWMAEHSQKIFTITIIILIIAIIISKQQEYRKY